jgi:hypothetical protein
MCICMWFILLCMILYWFYCSAMGTMIGLIKYSYSYSYSHTSEIWIFEVIFVVFRLMKNIIFNKTESFVSWRNTSDHACQIFSSKNNSETMWNYVTLMFPPRDNRGQNNKQSECSHSYLYSRSRFNQVYFLVSDELDDVIGVFGHRYKRPSYSFLLFLQYW